MFVAVQERLSDSWNTWNVKVDQFADKAIDFSVKVLPLSWQTALTGEYRTQTKITVIWFASAVISQVTFGNPLINWKISYPLGVLGNLALAGRIHFYMKEHLSSLDLPKNETVVSLSVPTISTGLVIADAVVNACKRSFQMNFSCSLWAEYIVICGSIYLSKAILLKVKEAEWAKKIYQREMDENKNKKEFLSDRIKKITNFINTHSELKEEAEKTLQENQADIARLPKVKTHSLNPNDPDDQLTLLKLDCLKQEHVFKEMKIFLQSHDDLWVKFKETVESELDWRPTPPAALLLEDNKKKE